jgi:Tfp pilus assembly protein PilN
MNENINLLDPNKKNTVLGPSKGMQGMRLFAGGLLFLVSVSAVIIFILVALSPLPALKREEASLRLTLASGHKDMLKLAYVDERTTTIDKLLNNRKAYDQILDSLQSNMPANVSISNIRVDNGAVALTVESKSLQSLDTYLSGLMQLVRDQKGFSQITLTSLINDESQSDYTLTVTLAML